MLIDLTFHLSDNIETTTLVLDPAISQPGTLLPVTITCTDTQIHRGSFGGGTFNTVEMNLISPALGQCLSIFFNNGANNAVCSVWSCGDSGRINIVTCGANLGCLATSSDCTISIEATISNVIDEDFGSWRCEKTVSNPLETLVSFDTATLFELGKIYNSSGYDMLINSEVH